MRGIKGEAGAFTSHIFVTLGQLFAGEKVWVCRLEMLVQEAAVQGTGALLHLPAG